MLKSFALSSLVAGAAAMAPPDIVRGVNVGGYFVPEPWIVPSFFTDAQNATAEHPPIDLYTVCEQLGAEATNARLKAHWDSWATQDEFDKLAAVGINTLRLPVGYWMFQESDHYEGCWDGALDALDALLERADKAGLGVLLDLHGLPGSQNSFDNSGWVTFPNWTSADSYEFARDPQWQHGDPLASIESIEFMAKNYGQKPVWGIELANEPWWETDMAFLKTYYDAGYQAVAANAPEADTAVVIHDSFRPTDPAWAGYMTEHPNVLMDSHLYSCFNDYQIEYTEGQHIDEACGANADMLQQMEQTQVPVFVGEWSLATTDCAQWLDGVNQDPAAPGYTGTPCKQVPCAALGNCTDDPDPSSDEFLTEFAAAQMDAFETMGSGWIFWTYRTEVGNSRWDFLSLVERGLWPEMGGDGFCQFP